jgi:hypothetical protein
MELVRDLIRKKLNAFITRREKAYQHMISKGHAVPAYGEKMQAIKSLRVQMNASASWDLRSNLLWIHSMRDQIHVLLPFEFHDDPKQRAYRKRILDLLRYCEDLLISKPISLLKFKAA